MGILIIVPALGIGDMTSLYNWLMRLNAVCMPLRYLWVFYAYMMLKKHQDRFQSDYHFVKSAALGKMAGAWCFFFTAYACFMGMFPRGVAAYSPAWTFQFTLEHLDSPCTFWHWRHPPLPCQKGTGKTGTITFTGEPRKASHRDAFLPISN